MRRFLVLAVPAAIITVLAAACSGDDDFIGDGDGDTDASVSSSSGRSSTSSSSGGSSSSGSTSSSSGSTSSSSGSTSSSSSSGEADASTDDAGVSDGGDDAGSDDAGSDDAGSDGGDGGTVTPYPHEYGEGEEGDGCFAYANRDCKEGLRCECTDDDCTCVPGERGNGFFGDPCQGNGADDCGSGACDGEVSLCSEPCDTDADCREPLATCIPFLYFCGAPRQD